MNRIRHVLAAALVATALAAIGCGDNIANGPGPHTPGKVGSGSINNGILETVALTTGEVYSQFIYVGSIDGLSVDLYAPSGTAACTVTPEVSDRFNPNTDSNSDTTKWTAYAPSGWVAPAAISSGAVTGYIINAAPLLERWWHVHYHCTSGTTTLTQGTSVKGG